MTRRMTAVPVWRRADVTAEVRRRVHEQLDARELVVDYYRVGFRFAFELPVGRRPDAFPEGVLGTKPYPWLIWLGWRLEERWRVLAYGARSGIDGAAERIEALLRTEFEALGGWSSYDAEPGGAGLVTAALASALADVLDHADAHSRPVVDAARAVGERIVTESVAPWFDTSWQDVRDPGPAELHNIRCITLFRGAQLADALGHPRAPALRARAGEVFRAWADMRRSARLTEGAGYDGYLLDSLTEWLAARSDSDQLRASTTDVLAGLPACWANLTLPGRPDLLAPLGDTEAEMTFWAGAALRLCAWFPASGASRWLRRFPLARLPANALAAAAALADGESGPASETFATGRHEQPGTLTIRTGPGDPDDVLVAIGAGRSPMGHLHYDVGHVVLGWQRRFWITDPGYQQYRQGAEREYTLDPDAHNAPVLDGIAQTVRAAVVESVTDGTGFRLDLTGCYEGLLPDVSVHRAVWLAGGAGELVVVRDTFAGWPAGTAIDTHWLADGALAWSFVDGYARLGDGQRALWIGTHNDVGGGLDARMLRRHPGTRGPIHLRHADHTDGDTSVRTWVFVLDPDGGWTPPASLTEPHRWPVEVQP